MKHSIHKEYAPERRRFLRAGAGRLAGLAALSFERRADAARSDPMHILCSGPAGSIPDLVARAVGDQLSITLGQRVVVDNRPGAAGQISVSALIAAPADGSTLLLAQGAIATVYPYLYAKLAYDPAVDLQPVSLASEMSLGLAVGPAVPTEVTTLAVAWQHVAYSGGPPAVTALLGGQIAALALPEGLLRQHHSTRRVRVLATSGPGRSAYLPEVPSFVERGVPTSWSRSGSPSSLRGGFRRPPSRPFHRRCGEPLPAPSCRPPSHRPA
jgi:tripartite-type tricarboxylate transporter receptor subunit TctC